jgi:hypothetical protein
MNMGALCTAGFGTGVSEKQAIVMRHTGRVGGTAVSAEGGKEAEARVM